MKIARLRNIREIVKEILENELLSREDDFYLILKVVQKLYPEDCCNSFTDVMLGMKYKGLSFEGITRARRKVQEQYPQLRNNEVAEIRDKEQEEYIEFAKEE